MNDPYGLQKMNEKERGHFAGHRTMLMSMLPDLMKSGQAIEGKITLPCGHWMPVNIRAQAA